MVICLILMISSKLAFSFVEKKKRKVSMYYPQKSPYFSTKTKFLKFRDFFYSFQEWHLHKEILSITCTMPVLNKLPNQRIWKISGACTTHKKAERIFYNRCPWYLQSIHGREQETGKEKKQNIYLELFFPHKPKHSLQWVPHSSQKSTTLPSFQ